MKRFLILSLIIYEISAQPVLPQEDDSSIRKPVEDVLHHLAGIAVKLNATDIPDAVARLPRPQLVSCMSSGQRELFRACKSHGMMKSMETFTKGCGENTGDMKMQMPLAMEDNVYHRQRTPAVAECILMGIKVMDTATGQINVTQLREKMIDSSSLANEQKVLAGNALVSCMASERSRQNSKNKTAEMDDMTSMMMLSTNQSNPMKAMICVMKALIKNGCAGDVDTRSERAALAEMAIEFAAFDETEEDSDESVEASMAAPNNMMARMMKKHSRERHGHRSKERPGHDHRPKSKEHGHRSKEHGHKSKEHGHHHHHHHGHKKSQEKSEEDMTSSTSSSTSTSTTTTSTTTKPTTTSTTTTPSTTTSSTRKPTRTTQESSTTSKERQGDQN